jgi:hypothetical protein
MWKHIGTRTRGRPRKRWIADIEEDLQIMGVRRWRKQCEERSESLRRLKPTVGCNASKRRRRMPVNGILYFLFYFFLYKCIAIRIPCFNGVYTILCVF